MKRLLKILFLAVLFVGAAMQYRLFDGIGFGPTMHNDTTSVSSALVAADIEENVKDTDYFISDTIYRWDEMQFDWIVSENWTPEIDETLRKLIDDSENSSDPIEIDWQVLMNIEYKMRYFAELEMDAYAPVFSKAVEALEGKDVIVQGYVIPFDENGEAIVLSYNSYANCFFCGKASPASIMSVYFKNNKVDYKLDDFIKFRGTLHLNHDDPKEFYYLLKDAQEHRK